MVPQSFLPAARRKLRVFLCHVSEDKPVVREIYQKLVRYNIEPWFDEKNLLPGENWELLIPEVIRTCDIILLCLSRTFLVKEGYGNYEVRVVLEAARRKPPETIYHIPYRLDDCEVPAYLAGIHYVSNFVPEDFEKLLAACEKRREWLMSTQAASIEPIRQQAPATAPSVSGSTLSAHSIVARTVSDPLDYTPEQSIADQSVRIEHFTATGLQNQVHVFLSYAREDARLLSQLEAHLSGLKREGLISTWCNRQIMPGAHWAGVIDQHLEQASLILLLVSSDFLASDYCYQIEVKRALERHRSGKAVVIPVIVRPTDWQSTPLAVVQPLPQEGRAVTDWSNPDQAFVNIVAGIRHVVEELARPSPSPADLAMPALATLPRDQSIQGAGYPAIPRRVVETQAPRGPAPARPESFDRPSVQSEPRSRQIFPGQAPTTGARFGAPFPETWNVPRRHNAFFTGRTPVLDQLFHTFRYENAASMIPPQVITGLGGMGKTQAAAEYAYRFRAEYQAVLWVRADTQEHALADFKTIAGLLKRPQRLLHTQSTLLQTMREWFMSQSNWLLIFDNADTPDLVDPFVPRAAQGHILVTTRAGAVAAWTPQHIRLEGLDAEAAALCILRRAGLLTEQHQLHDAPARRAETALQLAEVMQGLPLALEQAGAYINDTDCGVRKYLELYTKYRAEIQSRPHGELREYPESVASVWKISRLMVEQSNPAAAELLRLCAFLDPDGIPDELVLAGASTLGPVLGPVASDELLFNQAISILKRYSLLHREVDRETELTKLSIHRVMQEILLDEMDQGTRYLWAQRSVCAVEQARQRVPDPWPLLQAQAHTCLQLIAQWQMTFPEAHRLRTWVADCEGQEEHRSGE